MRAKAGWMIAGVWILASGPAGCAEDGSADQDDGADSDTGECEEDEGAGECPDAGDLFPTGVAAIGEMLDEPVDESCTIDQSLCDATDGLTCCVLEYDDWGHFQGYALVVSGDDALAAVVGACPNVAQIPVAPDWGAQQLVLAGALHLYDTSPSGQIHMDYRLSEHEDGQVHVDMYHWTSMGGSMDSDAIFMNAFALVDTVQVPSVCLYHHAPCD